MNANDKRVMELKQQVAEKKKLIAKSSKFVPITNCSIEIDTIRHNLNVLNREQLVLLAVKLKSYLIAKEALEITDSIVISGYDVEDWITDICAKMNLLKVKEEDAKLKALEAKLHQLLSEDKKVELAIDAIMEEMK